MGSPNRNLHMTKRHPFRGAALVPVIAYAVLAFVSISPSSRAQALVSEERIVVTGDDIGSAYGAPGGFSRSRFAPLTQAYVLPPWGFYFGEIYEGDAFRHGPPDHLFTQEVEMGLPYRFGVAAETTSNDSTAAAVLHSASLEGRYAFADWGKIPLNPTVFAEYKFGVGTIRHEEGPPPPPGEKEEEEAVRPRFQMPTKCGCFSRTNSLQRLNGR